MYANFCCSYLCYFRYLTSLLVSLENYFCYSSRLLVSLESLFMVIIDFIIMEVGFKRLDYLSDQTCLTGCFVKFTECFQ